MPDKIRLLHTYHSNAIEGNTLTLRETKLVVEEGITIGARSLREHLEAVGNAEAFYFVEELAQGIQPINHINVQKIHEIVTRGQLRESGKYRTENVRIAGAIKSPPDFSKIIEQLDAYFHNIYLMSTNAMEIAAYIHHRFVEIHPFIDGNGRVARLLTNLYLLSNGYPPLVLKKQDRNRYYAYLHSADQGNLEPLTRYIAKAEDDSLTIYISIFGGDDELIPLGQLSGTSSYSQEYLSFRARQGILDAVKIRNIWYSSKRALEEYIHKHGRETDPTLK